MVTPLSSDTTMFGHPYVLKPLVNVHNRNPSSTVYVNHGVFSSSEHKVEDGGVKGGGGYRAVTTILLVQAIQQNLHSPTYLFFTLNSLEKKKYANTKLVSFMINIH